jgi:RNA polymerase sigma factor (sigma-70 family)
MSEPAIHDLLERLASGQADGAWTEFLHQFSPLIMQVVRRYETDQERASDCYLYACGALSDDAFQRLRRFQPDGSARFATWLSAVVSNLCIDWTRKQRGRPRLSLAIAGLPELEQLVYRHMFVRGLSRDECLNALQTRFPELTGQRLSEINSRLFALLTPQQRWQLSTRRAATHPLRYNVPTDDDEPAVDVEDPGPTPDEIAGSDQARASLRAALARLPPQLRYQHDLTLSEVARLMRLGNPVGAHRQIQAALKALTKLMNT